jgi:hypothetical protein
MISLIAHLIPDFLVDLAIFYGGTCVISDGDWMVKMAPMFDVKKIWGDVPSQTPI